jgi:hypothetical protein
MHGSLKARKRPHLTRRGCANLPLPAASATVASKGVPSFAGNPRSSASQCVASARLKASAAHSLALTFDHGLVAAGILAAVGSASFAGFMLARDNSHPRFGGIEHLMIFAQPIHGHRPPLMARPERRSVDYRAIGSMELPPLLSAAGGESSRSEEKADAARSALAGYVLRFAPRGDVVVEGPKGSFAAIPGVNLPSAGRILSIQNRNGRWVVMTENGMIAERAPSAVASEAVAGRAEE